MSFKNTLRGMVGGLVMGALAPFMAVGALAVMRYSAARSPGRKDDSLLVVGLWLAAGGSLIATGAWFLATSLALGGLPLPVTLPLLYFAGWGILGSFLGTFFAFES